LVFEAGQRVGYAAIVQATVGVQLGGQTFSQVIAFRDKAALGRFKRGKLALAANASAVVVKAGAAASADYENGAAVLVHAEGGLALEAAAGGQKFVFRPAVLGRLMKKAPRLSTTAPPSGKKNRSRRGRGAGTPSSDAQQPGRAKGAGRAPR
jgi:hypothetical protein